MSTGRYYAPGDWNATCDVCGFAFKASLLRKNWQGLMVCAGDFETRQPQDYVRATIDKQTPPWTRIRPVAVFALNAIITEDSGGDFALEVDLMTETTSQPLFTET